MFSVVSPKFQFWKIIESHSQQIFNNSTKCYYKNMKLTLSLIIKILDYELWSTKVHLNELNTYSYFWQISTSTTLSHRLDQMYSMWSILSFKRFPKFLAIVWAERHILGLFCSSWHQKVEQINSFGRIRHMASQKGEHTADYLNINTLIKNNFFKTNQDNTRVTYNVTQLHI